MARCDLYTWPVDLFILAPFARFVEPKVHTSYYLHARHYFYWIILWNVFWILCCGIFVPIHIWYFTVVGLAHNKFNIINCLIPIFVCDSISFYCTRPTCVIGNATKIIIIRFDIIVITILNLRKLHIHLLLVY